MEGALLSELSGIPPSSSCLSVNSNGGTYRHGHAYSADQKWRFIRQYNSLKAHGGCVSQRGVAAELGVSKTFATKIIQEAESGEFINPHHVEQERVKGDGSKALTPADESVLLQLRTANPALKLKDYRRLLLVHTGTDVSESVLCRWFDTRFPYSASLRKPSLVPRDKFKPDNIIRAAQYIEFVANLVRQGQAYRLKFGDEKHLKGGELFTRMGRRCPLTGAVPDMVADPDFRNTYSIIGFCGIDSRTVPVLYNINMLTNDAIDFSLAIETAIAVGFLQHNDILVLDNAAIHIGAENDVLADFLWDMPSPFDGCPMHIYLLLLPPRSPELNPQELVWSQLVTHLGNAYLYGPRPTSHAPVYFASKILDSFTHHDIAKCYKHCGYLS